MIQLSRVKEWLHGVQRMIELGLALSLWIVHGKELYAAESPRL